MKIGEEVGEEGSKEEGRKEGRKEGRGRTTVIKSNNPHLAGGENRLDMHQHKIRHGLLLRRKVEQPVGSP